MEGNWEGGAKGLGPRLGEINCRAKGKDRNLVGRMQERASNEPSGALLTSMVTVVRELRHLVSPYWCDRLQGSREFVL